MKRRVVELESWVRKREMDERVTERQRERVTERQRERESYGKTERERREIEDFMESSQRRKRTSVLQEMFVDIKK